jgi:thiosulfate/3-mercaptopyruvate sulfurtransferase
MLLASQCSSLSAEPTLKFPTPIENKDAYYNGAWDTGLAIVAGQPTDVTLRGLKEKGFKVVVNFRTPKEMEDRKATTFDEEALVKELGMKYVNLPLGGPGSQYPDRPEVVDKLAEALKGNEGKTLVHCTVGWRASYVWTAYIHKYQGLELSEAVRHGQAIEVSRFLEDLIGTPIKYTPDPKKKDPPPAAAPAESGWTAIISPQQAIQMEGEGATLLDVRANYMEYIDGHIKGAVHMDANSLRGPKQGLPVQYRTVAEMTETLRLAGVSNEKPVIVYANPTDILGASMTMYVLQKLGIKNSLIIDGGSVSGAAAGVVEKPIPVVEAGDFKSHLDAGVSATIGDVEKALKSGGVTFVDARPPAQYSGEQNLWVRNGHIPGAINVFWKTLVQDENTHAFKSKADIEALFSSKGIKADQDVIVYCGTSKEATLIWMMLSRELGFKHVRVFEGAWTEYANRSTLPVATGPNP